MNANKIICFILFCLIFEIDEFSRMNVLFGPASVKWNADSESVGDYKSKHKLKIHFAGK